MTKKPKQSGGPGRANQPRSGGQRIRGQAVDVRHRTIAWYDSPEDLRHVELDLERHGVDSVHISTPPVDSEERRNEMDDKTMKWAFSRAVIGLVVGAVAGALIAAAISAAFVDTFKGALLFAVAGAAFGGFAGFFYGVFVNLPTDPDVFDTFGMHDDDATPNWIAVEGTPEDRETASQVMADHDPRKLIKS